LIITFSIFFTLTPSRDRRVCDLVERPARRTFGIEFGRDESRERQAEAWRFAAFLALEKRNGSRF